MCYHIVVKGKGKGPSKTKRENEMKDVKNIENEVFAEMAARLEKYEAECKEFDATKEEKKASLSRDEYFDWLVANDKPEYPLSGGESKALRLWFWSETEELQYDDFVWEREAHDFIDALRRAGVKTLVVTNQSTALMENMHWFVSEGCTLMGLCEVENKDHWGGTKTKMGVRFAL